MPNRDLLISTLSDPIRRDILSTLNRVVWLYGSEIQILCELHLGYPISQPTMSRHISTLVEYGLITEKRDGAIKRYGINREEVNKIGDTVEALLKVRTRTGARGKAKGRKQS